MHYTTKELTPDTCADFERLFAADTGWAFCGCMFFQRGRHLRRHEVSDGESARLRNLSDKRALVDARRAHGILVYDGAEPVGWCQFGPTEELPIPGEHPVRRIPPAAPQVRWRITCFVTAVRHRRRGVATIALRAALAAIRAQGGGLVEAYPPTYRGDRVPAHAREGLARSHAGTVSIFEREGFITVGDATGSYVRMQRRMRASPR